MLRLLAFQIGSEVSLNELGKKLSLSKETVNCYIDLLEKSFVIFRLNAFSRNLRKEITKMDKIYFYDLGIRNALINNFNDMTFRDDTGKLWENFIIAERKKFIQNNGILANTFFYLYSKEDLSMTNLSLYTKISTLPDYLKSEVIDFIDFLNSKRKKRAKKQKRQGFWLC